MKDETRIEMTKRATGGGVREGSCRRSVWEERPLPVKYEYPFEEDSLDPDAVKVIRRLQRFGHVAYLVGGCVRDLLLGLHPKDFDVATSATPEEVRALFRNSRIIGRRFRIVHVYFKGEKTIEVSTFRSRPKDSKCGEPILDDNEYGSCHEDAYRRDFSVNALFYNVDRQEIIDYVGGIADLKKRLLVPIAPAHICIKEDPVRIIRGLKIATRLELTMVPPLEEAIRNNVSLLSGCSTARALEELMKIFRSGTAEKVFAALERYEVLQTLLPTLYAMWNERDGGLVHFRRYLAAIDSLPAGERKALQYSAVFCCLIQPAVPNPHFADGDGWEPPAPEEIHRLLESEPILAAAPRREKELAKVVLLSQRKFFKRLAGKGKYSPSSLMRKAHFPDSFRFFLLSCFVAGERSRELEQRWRQHVNGTGRKGQRQPRKRQTEHRTSAHPPRD